MKDKVILKVEDLKVHFHLDEGILKAVDGVSFDIRQGRTLGIVGESGCGKSVTSFAMLRLLPDTAKFSGNIAYDAEEGREPVNILETSDQKLRSIRGGGIAMIFQEPMKAFSPVHTIGDQIGEAVMLHVEPNPEKAREIVLDALRKVGMSNPEQRIGEYTHQLSGGMRQRALIAMSIACRPRILIADEPTTALDVTVQAQVLDLISELKEDFGSAVIFITHDLGVIAEMSDEVAVMYLGKVVEYADVDTLFHDTKHPYTKALMRSMPDFQGESGDNKQLETIEGTVPYPMNLPPGCGFYSRCRQRIEGRCNIEEIPLTDMGEKNGVKHLVRCLSATITDEKIGEGGE